MTAPAVAPASPPIAAGALRASPQPQPADAHGFAMMLDSLPGGMATGALGAGEEARSSAEKRPNQPSRQNHSPLDGGSLIASLPFAFPAVPTIGARLREADPPGSPAPKGTLEAASSAAGAGTAVPGKAAPPGRLIAERAFHLASAVTNGPGVALAADPPFAPDAPLAGFAPEAKSSGGPAVAADVSRAEGAAAAPRPGKPARASPARPADEEVRSGPKPEAGPAPPAVRAANPAKIPEPAGSSGDGAGDGRLPDPAASAAQPAAQGPPFGAPLSTPYGAAAAFAPDGSSAPQEAPLARAPGPIAAPAAAPVREIDVDLSPGGIGDVSMTMRLAGDRLSLVVRAASSRALSSIEGARDAIADRLAAIGQPLDSLIIKQTGFNADGTNTNPADEGSAGDAWRPAQGAGDRDGSNDGPPRRGAHRDRGP